MITVVVNLQCQFYYEKYFQRDLTEEGRPILNVPWGRYWTEEEGKVQQSPAGPFSVSSWQQISATMPSLPCWIVPVNSEPKLVLPLLSCLLLGVWSQDQEKQPNTITYQVQVTITDTNSYTILTCLSDDVIWVTELVEDKYKHHRDSEGNNTMCT